MGTRDLPCGTRHRVKEEEIMGFSRELDPGIGTGIEMGFKHSFKPGIGSILV
jgi:hypothetical protein